VDVRVAVVRVAVVRVAVVPPLLPSNIEQPMNTGRENSSLLIDADRDRSLSHLRGGSHHDGPRALRLGPGHQQPIMEHQSRDTSGHQLLKNSEQDDTHQWVAEVSVQDTRRISN
jgi:hypothetical protein